MCVAAIIGKGAPVPYLEDLEAMEKANPHGAGVAWPQLTDDGIVKVAYAKNLSAKEVHSTLTWLNEQGAGPALFHFRWASAGGLSKYLCHPFVVEPYPSLKLEGIADQVLIHNGHWSEWESLALTNCHLFADGDKQPWSDTRVAAHLMSLGTLVQSDIGGKTATLGSDMKVHKTGSWTAYNGVLYSNTHWRRRTESYFPEYTRYTKRISEPTVVPHDRHSPYSTRKDSVEECFVCETRTKRFRVLDEARRPDDFALVVCQKCDWVVWPAGGSWDDDCRLFTEEELGLVGRSADKESI